MELSVFYDHILEGAAQSGKSVEECVKHVSDWGVKGLEIRYALLRKDFEKITAMLEQNGMRVSCIFEFYDFANDPGTTAAKGQVDMAQALGVRRILVVPGELDRKEADELNSLSGAQEAVWKYMEGNEKIRNIRQALTELAAYGKERGIEVTLEDFDGPVQPFARIDQLLWFMQEVPGLKYTLDMGNFAFSDEDVEAAYAVLKDYIVHVHCKDRAIDPALDGKKRFSRGLGAAPAGGGYLPIGSLVERLKAQGYNGYLAIEHYGAPDQMGYIEESARFLGRYLY